MVVTPNYDARFFSGCQAITDTPTNCYDYPKHGLDLPDAAVKSFLGGVLILERRKTL